MSTRGRRNEPTAAGRWLRRQRELRGIATQAELARQLGWDKTAVNNYETRGVEVPSERAEQLAEFFELDEIEVRRHLGLWVPKKARSPMDEAEAMMDENERLIAEIVENARRAGKREKQAVLDLLKSANRGAENPDAQGDAAP
jgi:transcriptional regulator with XRE-family HTH domain